MLNETALVHLSALTYRPDADRRTILFPTSGIYWDDEIPDFPELMKLPEDGLMQILRLFGIRYRIWQGEPLPEDDQQFWNDAKSQLPDCPVFQRVNLSTDNQLAQDAAARRGAEVAEALLAAADQVTVIEKCPGVQGISATFNLMKYTDHTSPSTVRVKPWWARIFSGRNPRSV